MTVGAPQTLAGSLFDPALLDRDDTEVRSAPFCFLVAREQLPADAAHELNRDFPKYASAGFSLTRKKTAVPASIG